MNEINQELRFEIHTNNTLNTNLREILKNSSHEIIDIYLLNDHLYATYLRGAPNAQEYCDIYTYKISTSSIPLISKADFIFTLSSQKCDLTNFHTLEERRRGHASRCLQHIIQLAIQENIKHIYGIMPTYLPKELEETSMFYIANGFETHEHSFFKRL